MKFFAPEQTDNLREQIINIIDADDDYPAMVEALGKKISQADFGEELVKVFGLDNSGAGVQKHGTMPGAVNVFLEKQKKFTGFEIPENVEPGMPELPFEYASPVSGHCISGFGFREDEDTLQIEFHYGVDCESENEVNSFASGKVYAVGSNESLGNYIIIHHSDDYQSLYGHLDECFVQEGTDVKKGEMIATVKADEHSSKAYVHFELSKDGVHLNPEYYI